MVQLCASNNVVVPEGIDEITSIFETNISTIRAACKITALNLNLYSLDNDDKSRIEDIFSSEDIIVSAQNIQQEAQRLVGLYKDIIIYSTEQNVSAILFVEDDDVLYEEIVSFRYDESNFISQENKQRLCLSNDTYTELLLPIGNTTINFPILEKNGQYTDLEDKQLDGEYAIQIASTEDAKQGLIKVKFQDGKAIQFIQAQNDAGQEAEQIDTTSQTSISLELTDGNNSKTIELKINNGKIELAVEAVEALEAVDQAKLREEADKVADDKINLWQDITKKQSVIGRFVTLSDKQQENFINSIKICSLDKLNELKEQLNRISKMEDINEQAQTDIIKKAKTNIDNLKTEIENLIAQRNQNQN